jgi:hypothetical protein
MDTQALGIGNGSRWLLKNGSISVVSYNGNFTLAYLVGLSASNHLHYK